MGLDYFLDRLSGVNLMTVGGLSGVGMLVTYIGIVGD
jgi:hypothetical protein